ncbi:MAG: RluA family pseudouridine synthase [Spirochaetaceae bacterium]|nr:RluA family pseudouridine synthase [Spirochaetaceae bacterium]
MATHAGRPDRKPAPGAVRAESCGERHWQGTASESGSRTDKYLADIEHVLTRSQLKARSARILVNGRPERFSRKLKTGDQIDLFWTDEPAHDFAPENLPLDILYENGNVFVINKAQGMVTHPANGNWSGTLANAILGLENERAVAAASAPGGGRSAGLASGQDGLPCADPGQGQPVFARGGIVHRLDKDTSGVIIVARNAETQAFLSDQFRNRQTRKAYIAIVQGQPEELAGRIDNQLCRDRKNRKKFASCESGGRRAVTDYRVLSRWTVDGMVRYSVIMLYPRTGRTHQLRVHMAEMNCPILGDPLYGRKDRLFPEAELMLHAYRLKINLPEHSEPSVFTAPVPNRFHVALAGIKARCKPLI